MFWRVLNGTVLKKASLSWISLKWHLLGINHAQRGKEEGRAMIKMECDRCGAGSTKEPGIGKEVGKG